jgi:tetratricopeptide (TPR) repeat protein
LTVAEALSVARRAPGDAVAAARLASAALDAQEEEQALPIVRAAAERLGNARLWQWAGLLHRALDDRAPAIEEFAAAARLAPADPGIAHGRARVTLEAGLPASALFERARALAPGDGTVLLGLVAAELAEGEGERATARLAAAVAGSPDWIEGHDQLARLCWMLGDRDGFTRSYRAAIGQRPGNAVLWQALLIALLHADRFDEVVETVARGRKALGDAPFLDAAAAVAASETGRIEEADALFAKLAHLDESSLAIRQVRHLLRTGRLDAAAPLVERWIERPEAALMWPYAAILWRLTGDPRAEWLDAGGALVKVIDLTPSLPPLDRLAETLRGLHRARNQHLDQSVRGGTQTDGALFARIEPDIRATRAAVVAAVESYVAALPLRDPRHPTLAPRRDRTPRFAGSWSVRLDSAGAHANHVHPAGWISSALYIALPDALPGDAGSLTLGAPQAELRLDLPPERIIAPRPGQLVLFPSTMWHGTIPFEAGERLTIAFDVATPAP